MDTLLTTIPAIAKSADISTIPVASLLGVSGTVAAGSTGTAKSSAGAAASTATKTTAPKSSATRAAATAKAAGPAASSKAWRAALAARTIAILSTGIIAKPARTTPKTGTEVATWISADLLQPATQGSIQKKRFISAIALYTSGNFRLSRGAAAVLAFDLIGQLRRGRSLLVTRPATLLTRLCPARWSGRRSGRWTTAGKLRRSLTLGAGWPRPALPGSLLRWRRSRGSRSR